MLPARMLLAIASLSLQWAMDLTPQLEQPQEPQLPEQEQVEHELFEISKRWAKSPDPRKHSPGSHFGCW